MQWRAYFTSTAGVPGMEWALQLIVRCLVHFVLYQYKRKCSSWKLVMMYHHMLCNALRQRNSSTKEAAADHWAIFKTDIWWTATIQLCILSPKLAKELSESFVVTICPFLSLIGRFNPPLTFCFVTKLQSIISPTKKDQFENTKEKRTSFQQTLYYSYKTYSMNTI